MAFQISVQPGAHRFAAEADETILDAALRQGLDPALWLSRRRLRCLPRKDPLGRG